MPIQCFIHFIYTLSNRAIISHAMRLVMKQFGNRYVIVCLFVGWLLFFKLSDIVADCELHEFASNPLLFARDERCSVAARVGIVTILLLLRLCNCCRYCSLSHPTKQKLPFSSTTMSAALVLKMGGWASDVLVCWFWLLMMFEMFTSCC
jgi:hypothetical protein